MQQLNQMQFYFHKFKKHEWKLKYQSLNNKYHIVTISKHTKTYHFNHSKVVSQLQAIKNRGPSNFKCKSLDESLISVKNI